MTIHQYPETPASPPVIAPTNETASEPTASSTASAANASNGSEERIRARMLPRRASFTYQPPDSVVLREDEMLARLWGCKPESAHQRKLRAMRDVVDVILVKREAQALDSLAGYTAPLEDALAANPQPDCLHREALTDAEEDVLQENYRADPNEQTARALLRKRASMRQAALDCDREIAAKHGVKL